MTSISIITPTYNADKTINDCIQSIRQQDLSVEHIIIDNNSTDNTHNIIEKNSSHIAYFISEPDKGLYDAINKGIKIAKGDIIGILNADDIYYKSTALKKVLNSFKNTNIDSCYGNLVYVDQNNTDKTIRYWKSGDYRPEKFFWGWMPPHPTFFIRRELYIKYGLYNLQLGSAADYELMLRFLLKQMITTTYIPETIIKMRTGGISNLSLKNRVMANIMDRKAWKTNGLTPYPWTLFFKPLRKINQWLSKPGIN